MKRSLGRSLFGEPSAGKEEGDSGTFSGGATGREGGRPARWYIYLPIPLGAMNYGSKGKRVGGESPNYRNSDGTISGSRPGL